MQECEFNLPLSSLCCLHLCVFNINISLFVHIYTYRSHWCGRAVSSCVCACMFVCVFVCVRADCGQQFLGKHTSVHVGVEVMAFLTQFSPAGEVEKVEKVLRPGGTEAAQWSQAQSRLFLGSQ